MLICAQNCLLACCGLAVKSPARNSAHSTGHEQRLSGCVGRARTQQLCAQAPAPPGACYARSLPTSRLDPAPRGCALLPRRMLKRRCPQRPVLRVVPACVSIERVLAPEVPTPACPRARAGHSASLRAAYCFHNVASCNSRCCKALVHGPTLHGLEGHELHGACMALAIGICHRACNAAHAATAAPHMGGC